MKYETVLEQIEDVVYSFQGRVENGADIKEALNWLTEEIELIKSGEYTI
jgi:hypothetical protein